MKTIIIWSLTIMLLMALTQAATLTCTQVSSSTLEIPQFSTDEIEIQCTASGGTVGNIQITPNPDPSSGLTITVSSSMPTSLGDQESGTARWSVTGDVPNTYTIAYTLISDGTEVWDGSSTTYVDVAGVAKLTVEYINPPSTYYDGATLDLKITNIGGTTANNIYLQLNNNPKMSYPAAIEAGASASFNWNNDNGFDSAGNYSTRVFIADTLQDSVNVEVSSPGATTTTTAKTTTTTEGGGGGAAGAILTTNRTTTTITPESFEMTGSSGSFKLKLNDKISFKLNEKQHQITLVAITLSKITLSINSEPIEITLAKGESKNVDVDSDKVNDLSIKLNDILNESGVLKAELSLRLIEKEQEQATEQEQVKQEEGKQPATEKQPQAGGETIEQPPVQVQQRGSYLPYILGGLVIVICALLLLKLYLVKKGGSHHGGSVKTATQKKPEQ